MSGQNGISAKEEYPPKGDTTDAYPPKGDTQGYLSRDEILAIDDAVFEDVAVPQWGNKKVRVLGLSGWQRDKFEASLTRQKQGQVSFNLENVRARLLAWTLAGPDGRLLFSESDIAALGKKSAAALDGLFEVAQRLSGFRKQDIEELAENFPGGQNGVSISA